MVPRRASASILLAATLALCATMSACASAGGVRKVPIVAVITKASLLPNSYARDAVA